MRLLANISGRLERLSGRRMLFVPVCLGLGVGGYFSLPVEPSTLALALTGLAATALALVGAELTRGRYAGLGFLLLGLVLVAAGGLAGALRSATVAAPVLDFRYYGPVEGRVVAIDRSASDAMRLTLDRVRLDRVAPTDLPARVRVSLHGDQPFVAPMPGQRLAMTAFLSGPEGPVEPGGFDFRRMAWFDRLGAVGYTRAPALPLPATVAAAGGHEGGGGVLVQKLRRAISTWVQARIPGEAGAFAAAITTGDRAAMSQETIQTLRDSNLAHLLAISGLHMGLLTAFVYAALRYALALVPGLADRVPIRKIAAIGALQAGAFYLALSGGSIATERAFIMVSVMFGAVLLDRRALTLRAVALAASLILLAQPESLTEPGFQMSFAATIALVFVFGALRDWKGWQPPRWMRPVTGVLLSSGVAGLATAPFAAAHFNQVSYYGLVANTLAVPVMGAAVMPLAVLTALAAPFGLGGVTLWLMQWPIRWILAVAAWVAGLDGAVGHVPSPGPWVLPLVAAGGLSLVLLRGRLRLAGLAPVAIAFALWADAERPPVLVAPSGGLVGVMTPEGRALSKPRGDGFTATVWLENDGDAAEQDGAAARRGFLGEKGALIADLGSLRVAALSGRGAADRIGAACAEADIVVVSTEIDAVPEGCAVFDPVRLQDTGALALWLEQGTLRIDSVADHSGQRRWTQGR
ncbi:MAG: ComEC/Rec2 family competence protein [Paracoccaceae bacterium]